VSTHWFGSSLPRGYSQSAPLRRSTASAKAGRAIVGLGLGLLVAACGAEADNDGDDGDGGGGGGFFAGDVGAGDVGTGGVGAGGVGTGGVGAGGVGAGGVGAGGAGAGGAGGSTASGGTGTGAGGTSDPGPCGGTPDQSQDAHDGYAFTDLRPLAQSFTAGASTLSEVSIYVHTNQQLDTFTIYVLGDDGGNPDINAVLGAADVQNSAVGVQEWLCADIADISVNPGSRYWILLNEGGSPVRKNWHESNEGGDPYPGGKKKVTNDGGASWKSYPGEDFTFRTYP